MICDKVLTLKMNVFHSMSVHFIFAQSPPWNCYNFPGMADHMSYHIVSYRIVSYHIISIISYPSSPPQHNHHYYQNGGSCFRMPDTIAFLVDPIGTTLTEDNVCVDTCETHGTVFFTRFFLTYHVPDIWTLVCPYQPKVPLLPCYTSSRSASLAVLPAMQRL